MQPGLYCQNCSEAFLSKEDIEVTEAELIRARREIDSLLSPDEIKKVRKSLELTQAQASELFGGGSQSFSKYERGIVLHGKALDILLRLLDSGSISLMTISNLHDTDNALVQTVTTSTTSSTARSINVPLNEFTYGLVLHNSSMTGRTPTVYCHESLETSIMSDFFKTTRKSSIPEESIPSVGNY